MNVLSLFDGMSCGRVALDRAGIKFDNYYASEIDKYAQIVSEANYPDIIRLGDITKWHEWDIEQPDIIMGGSPCQGFSFAGKQLNFEDERSKLFFVFVDILKHYKPKYFLLENVIMDKKSNDVISSILGELYPECVTQTELFRSGRLEPIMINSSLVSSQNRRRLYWTNIQGIEQPEDKGILLKDIIDNTEFEVLKCGAFRGRNPENPKSRKSGLHTKQMLEIRDDQKTNCLTTVQKDNVIITGDTWRKLTPIECERLQTLPDNFTEGVSNTQRLKMIVNGFTVLVIAHILKNIKKKT